MMKKQTCLLIVAMIGLSGVTRALDLPKQEAGGKRVEARGMAAGTGETAVEEAKLDALRAAVAKVCGAFINAQSETENFQILRDKVLEHPVGFGRIIRVVKGPDILGGELTEVTIEAEVFPADFERKWAEFAHILEREGNPRCVVVILEDENPYDNIPPVTNGLVQSALEDFYLGKGVRLMDRGATDAVKARDLKLAAEQGDILKAAAAGAAFKADVVILGTAEARQGDSVIVGGYEVKNWNVTLTLRAVQTDSAAILTSKTYTPKKPVSSTRLNARQALMKLGEDVAPDTLSDIGKAWRERATVGKTIEMRLQPVSRAQFKIIQDALAELKGVTGGRDGIKLRELTNRIATIDVMWKYDLNQLADRVESIEIRTDDQRMTFEITEQSANRIEVTVNSRDLEPDAVESSESDAQTSPGAEEESSETKPES